MINLNICPSTLDDKPAYITRRFDVHSGGKYKQEDFAALLGWSKDNGTKKTVHYSIYL